MGGGHQERTAAEVMAEVMGAPPGGAGPRGEEAAETGSDRASAGIGAVGRVERRGVEAVPVAARHGRASTQFTLWLGSNLTIADFALGGLAVSLGLSWGWTLAALVVGNLLGSAAVGACAAMGPVRGRPQLVQGSSAFGRLGARLPALLNYVSTLGWLAVNTVLGAEALRILLPSLPYVGAVVLLVALQGALAVVGHDLVHAFERAMSVALGVVFVIVSVVLIERGALGRHLAPPSAAHTGPPVGAALILLAAAFSYVASWAPYASDYSRYLPRATPLVRVGLAAAAGNFLASLWLELVGVAVSALAGASLSPVEGLRRAAGPVGEVAVIAIVLGAVAANALNVYSNGLAAGALGFRISRPFLAGVAAAAGLAAAAVGAGAFEARYEAFLLSLGYWVTPWLAVVLVDFASERRLRRRQAEERGVTRRAERQVRWGPVLIFVGAGLASIPFMDCPYYEGPVARLLGGGDVSYFVAFGLAATASLLLSALRRPRGLSRLTP